VKKLAVSLILLIFASEVMAQASDPAPARAPVQVAQAGTAGGPSAGAGAPPASGGATSTVAALVALGVAGVAAVTAYGSTTSNH
jgi:hypothetical protein